MSLFRSLFFVFLIGSSFFAHSTSFNVNLGELNQESDLFGVTEIINDDWNFMVSNGTSVTLVFDQLDFGLFNISGFQIVGDGSLSKTFFFTGFNEQVFVNGVADGDFGGAYTLTSSVSAVPLPAAAWLMGSALIGLVSFGRRKTALTA